MTDAEKEMVERLREKDGIGRASVGYTIHINPDGPEAAKMIEQLSAAAEKERAAIVAWLRWQTDYMTKYRHSSPYTLADAIERGDHLENADG